MTRGSRPRRPMSGWARASTLVCFLSLAWCLWHVEAIVARLALWTDSAPDPVVVLLGWAPADGLLVLAAGYLLWWWRRHRLGLPRRRIVQRVWVGLVAVWLGLALASAPTRALSRARFEKLVALPGPVFARAAEWAAWGLAAAIALGLATFVVVAHRLRDEDDLSDQDLAAAVFPWLAGALGLPASVVLAGLLAGLG